MKNTYNHMENGKKCMSVIIIVKDLKGKKK